jgi:hypothetical protein
MLHQGIIRHNSSSFSASVLLIRKSDDSWCFCVNYHALNAKIMKDKFPIPIIEELFNELCQAKLFTKLDLRSGYHQVWMHPNDAEKTELRSHQGLFEFLVMSFGLMNAPATFQALMNEVLRPFLCLFVLVFFDDILIYSPSWMKHLRHVQLVLTALQQHKLFLKHTKCAFGGQEVTYQGHVISTAGVAMDKQIVCAMLDWPLPRSARVVHAFLGLERNYHRFIHDYCTTAVPLTCLLRKEGFRWCQEAEDAFHALQHALTTTPVLQLLAFNWEFVVECDASEAWFGVVLHQGNDPVMFFSKPIAPWHAKLAAYERELIGLIQAIKHWRPYLWGTPFLIRTDHFSLKFLLDHKL